MTDKRAHLETIAQTHVQRGGLKSLSFRTLAKEAGIKSSSVHYYFPEKADLAEALIERYRECFMDDLDKISNNSKWTLKKKLTAFIEIFEDVSKNNSVCLCGMLAAEYEDLTDRNRKQLEQFFIEMEAWLNSVFNCHKKELISNIPTTKLVRAMISGLEGALLIDRLSESNRCITAQKSVIMSYLA